MWLPVSQEMGVKLGNEVRGVASGVRGVASGVRGVARVAAMSVAARVSQEMGVKLGNEVRG